MIPHFTVIIGAARCGTTSLFLYLAEHPQVCASRVKEPNFFASDEHCRLGRAWYERFFDWDPKHHRTALEASTAYSIYPLYPSAARRMREFGSEFKLIYILRDPLDQIASNYTHALSMGSPWTDPHSGWWEGQRINRFLLCAASYAQQLDEYGRYFAESQILLLRFEELTGDPKSLLAKICRFIGIDDSFPFSQTDQISNPTEGKVIPRVGWNALKGVRFLRNGYRRLPFRIRQSLHNAVGKKVNRSMVLTDEEQLYITANLGEGLVRLQEEHGLDTSKWQASRIFKERFCNVSSPSSPAS